MGTCKCRGMNIKNGVTHSYALTQGASLGIWNPSQQCKNAATPKRGA